MIELLTCCVASCCVFIPSASVNQAWRKRLDALFLHYRKFKLIEINSLASFLGEECVIGVFFFLSVNTGNLSVAVCFCVRTSWRRCKRSCLFKGRQDCVIHLRALVCPVVHDVTVIIKYWVEAGSLLTSS